jgi:hypothetical protein
MGGRAPTTTACQGASRVHRDPNRSTLARQALEVEVAAASSASRPSSEQRLPVQASVSARGVHTLARDEEHSRGQALPGPALANAEHGRSISRAACPHGPHFPIA